MAEEEKEKSTYTNTLTHTHTHYRYYFLETVSSRANKTGSSLNSAEKNLLILPTLSVHVNTIKVSFQSNFVLLSPLKMVFNKKREEKKTVFTLMVKLRVFDKIFIFFDLKK